MLGRKLLDLLRIVTNESSSRILIEEYANAEEFEFYWTKNLEQQYLVFLDLAVRESWLARQR
jgi:hypothetical protein